MTVELPLDNVFLGRQEAFRENFPLHLLLLGYLELKIISIPKITSLGTPRLDFLRSYVGVTHSSTLQSLSSTHKYPIFTA